MTDHLTQNSANFFADAAVVAEAIDAALIDGTDSAQIKAADAAAGPAGSIDEADPSCFSKHTERSDEVKKDLTTRLRRIEGQVRGLEGMVEKDAYCPDILIQVSAVTSALSSFSRQLLSNHIRGCVKRDVANGNDEAIDELCQLLQRLMK